MPVLHLVIGPNGAGKTTFFERVLSPITRLPLVNADVIARQRWPGDEEARGHDAAALAEQARSQAIAQRISFVAETVFSHPSKLDLLRIAREAGYQVILHLIVVPVELSVARVRLRSTQGGHSVPERKIRERHRRLWTLARAAIADADETRVYDNSSASRPYRLVERYERGRLLSSEERPAWWPMQ
ncbi:MAG: ATPase [Burkholderiales bacterium]|nr:MAG: ATPase [Burkholderiales bacterium]